MTADHEPARGTCLLSLSDRCLPRDEEVRGAHVQKGERRAIVLQFGMEEVRGTTARRVESRPSGVMHRDSTNNVSLERWNERRLQARRKSAGQVGMVHLGDQEPVLCRLFLFGFHRFPCGDWGAEFGTLLGSGLGVQRMQDHGYLLGARAACRPRMARAAAGPVPVGGLRAPSSNSLRMVALFCSAFLDAKTSVTFPFAIAE